MTTSTSPHPAKSWEFKLLRTRIKERVLSSTLVRRFRSISNWKGKQAFVNDLARASQVSLSGEFQSAFRPPPYLEVPLLQLHRPVSLNVDSTENDGQEALPEADMTRPVSIYGHSRVYDNSLEDLFASNESLPPFPADPVTEIVDLIRMAASLLYKEMQLVLISETQSGRFPTSRGDTWLRLGQLHRLISSWPDGTLSATDGIKSFGRSLNDGTILCEYFSHLSPMPIASPYYGPDKSGWALNLQRFIATYESSELPSSRETLLEGNPTFDDLGVQQLASYARAIIAIHERFGETAASLLQGTPSRSRTPRNSVASFALRLRDSSMESLVARRCSSHPNSQLIEPPLILESIDEDDALEDSNSETGIDPRVFDLPALKSLSHLDPPTSTESTRPPSPNVAFQLPKETRLFYKCLMYIMEDEERYREMLNAKGPDAQGLLDFFQHLLDLPQITGPSRNKILAALIKLSTASGLYPQCFALKYSDLQAERSPVTSGHFGEIFQGEVGGQRICIKVIKLYQKSHINTALKVFLKEVVIWGQLRHPNLLPFYGVYHLDDPYGRICLVSPWMENGTIVDYLLAHPDVNRLLLIRDIAQGLEFLHGNKIVHGDLKGVNVLVSEVGHACLADFGLSSLRDIEEIRFSMLESSGHRGGTPRWEAPELLEDSEAVIHRTPASDVYAFGCVCYEVFTGKIPFYELPKDFMVYIKVLNGERPNRPASGTWPVCQWGLTDGIWDLITQCWRQCSAERPSAQDILGSPHLKSIGDTRPQEPDILAPSNFRLAVRGSTYTPTSTKR